MQPEKIKNNAEFRARLEEIQPDAILVVAYGRIIPQWMLDLPRFGNINLHGSLLPKYRGAAPIQWAVANGEVVTGVTTMRLDEGLDTGRYAAGAGVPDRAGRDGGRCVWVPGSGWRGVDGGDAATGLRRGHLSAGAGSCAGDAGADTDARGWVDRFFADGAADL